MLSRTEFLLVTAVTGGIIFFFWWTIGDWSVASFVAWWKTVSPW